MGIFVVDRMVAQGSTQELAAGLTVARRVFEVGVDGDPGLVTATLGAVPGVGATEKSRRLAAIWQVTAEGDVSADLAVALVGAGLQLRSLGRMGEDLGEVYRHYYEGGR
jgi:hypothetical protein